MDLTPLELVVQICAAIEGYFELYVRIDLPEIAEYGQVKEFSVYADPELILIYLLKLLSESIVILNQFLGAIVECVPGFGKRALSCSAVKELHPELILKLCYVFAYGRLGYVTLLCGLRKAAAVGGCKEKIELAKVHINHLQNEFTLIEKQSKAQSVRFGIDKKD